MSKPDQRATDKKIILINPYPVYGEGLNEATIYPPLGLAYLASALRQKGFHDIRIIDANILQIQNDTLMKQLKEEKPDIIGLHLNVVLGRGGVELGNRIRKEIDCLICIGGPLVSSNPLEMLAAAAADIAVIGEGEITFAEICKGTPLQDISGLVYKDGAGVHATPLRPLIENIDEIPFPAYDLLPPLRLYKSRARRKPVGAILTSRGCPYLCTYCNASVFGKRFRARSPENVLQEIDLLVNDYGIRQLDILDDNFTLNIKRADRILDLLLERKYKLVINLQNGVRPDRIDEALIRKMKEVGVFKVGIGIESGDKDTLARIHKSLDLDKVVPVIRWFKKQGIVTYGFFMIGFADDTKESIEKTIAFAKQCDPTIVNFSLLMPFPGTAMHAELKARGLLKDESQLFYETGFFSPTLYHRCLYLTEEKLFAYQRKAYREFNFRIKKFLEVLFSNRTWNELRWTLEAAFGMLRPVLGFVKKKAAAQAEPKP